MDEVGYGNSYVDISLEARTLLKVLADKPADHFVQEILIPHTRKVVHREITLENAEEILSDPIHCLQAIYGCYAFSRRGKDRSELSQIALEALDRTVREVTVDAFLSEPDGSRIWNNFSDVCKAHHHKVLEQLNMGVVAGMAELAQEIFEIDGVGSIFGWVAEGVRQTGRIEPQFLRMVDVRGIGPKLASTILRDVVFLFKLEETLDHADRLYVQPVDKWLRLVFPFIVDEGLEDPADWILAGKMAKYCRRSGVSGIRFNMGNSYFGMRDVREPERFESVIEALIAKNAATLL